MSGRRHPYEVVWCTDPSSHREQLTDVARQWGHTAWVTNRPTRAAHVGVEERNPASPGAAQQPGLWKTRTPARSAGPGDRG
jgi:hypothetical protein